MEVMSTAEMILQCKFLGRNASGNKMLKIAPFLTLNIANSS
jgi:hypothetical protein